MDFTPEQRKHASIFHPHMLESMDRVVKNGTRFAYYTDADTALKIINGKEMWLRQTPLMNDHSEVRHGYTCLLAAYRDQHGKGLTAILNSIFPDISKDIEKRFDETAHNLEHGTFVACVSEHGGTGSPLEDAHEYAFGRLSMWRAYGRGCGVALVLNPKPLVSPTTALGVFTSPVGYMGVHDIGDQLRIISERIGQEREFVQARGRDLTLQSVLVALWAAVVCSKHPGFKDEREWRAVALPGLIGPKGIRSFTQTLNGIPQQIWAVPLKDVPSEGLVGLNIPDFIEKVIIGPTEAPGVIHGALWHAMTAQGFTDIPKRLSMSNIPLRVVAGR